MKTEKEMDNEFVAIFLGKIRSGMTYAYMPTAEYPVKIPKELIKKVGIIIFAHR